MLTLTPTVLEQEGKKQFVILPYSEFEALQEELQEYYDLKSLRAAIKEEENAPTVGLDEARRAVGLG